MHEVIAFVRRDALVAASYRTGLIMSLASLLTIVVPLFFIAGALQPVMGPRVADEGGHYFYFVVAGMIAFQFVTTAVGAIPTAIAGALRTGTFEALLATPARLSSLLAGMMGYPLLWTAARALTLFALAAALGAPVAPGRVVLALLICGLVALAYVPIGLAGAALLLLVRTTGPLPTGVMMISVFLGGVYYPTSIIPSWLQQVSQAVPLTHGLRAMRRVLTQDLTMAEVAGDLGVLAVITLVLMVGGAALLQFALAHARRAGSLAQF